MSRDSTVIRVNKSALDELRQRYPNVPDVQRINFAVIELKKYENSINGVGRFIYGKAWKK